MQEFRKIFLLTLVSANCASASGSGSTQSRPTLVPTLTFNSVCDPLSYSGLYLKHQLTLPVQVQLRDAAEFQLLEFEAKTDDALLNRDSNVRVMAQVTRQSGLAKLIFLCPTLDRCQQLKDFLGANPEALWHSVQFTVSGRIGSQSLRFVSLRAANLLSFSCDPTRWVVFQRRVDGNLSFAQNWDAYVNGFGSPDSNYWMGLHRLFLMTATASKNSYPETSRCRLRVELQDFSGRNYWGEYGMFQVLDPGQNYRLRLGHAVAGSQVAECFVSTHSEMQFSTFDRDNDREASNSCSQLYGFAGWWYSACHCVNLNGAYLTDRRISDSPVYISFHTSGKFPVMKTSSMAVKCT